MNPNDTEVEFSSGSNGPSLSVDDFLGSLKKMMDQLRAENDALRERAAQVPQLESEISDLKARLGLARQNKKTLQAIESLEVAAELQRNEIAQLKNQLELTQKEEQRLLAVVNDDQKLIRLKVLEDWVHSIADKVGIKKSSAIEATMQMISDSIRKLASK